MIYVCIPPFHLTVPKVSHGSLPVASDPLARQGTMRPRRALAVWVWSPSVEPEPRIRSLENHQTKMIWLVV